MKMAKASKADMDMALKLCSALEAVDRRFFPEGSEGSNDPEDLDLNDDEHCGQVLRHLHDVLQGGSIGRVIWGMYVLLDPANKLVDPNASTLETPNATAGFAHSTGTPAFWRWLQTPRTRSSWAMTAHRWRDWMSRSTRRCWHSGLLALSNA